jgi:hypothetical protein
MRLNQPGKETEKGSSDQTHYDNNHDADIIKPRQGLSLRV